MIDLVHRYVYVGHCIHGKLFYKQIHLEKYFGTCRTVLHFFTNVQSRLKVPFVTARYILIHVYTGILQCNTISIDDDLLILHFYIHC